MSILINRTFIEKFVQRIMLIPHEYFIGRNLCNENQILQYKPHCIQRVEYDA